DIIIAYGSPTAKQEKAFDDMGRIYREALQFWTPGRAIRDIARDVQRIVKAHKQVDPLGGHFIGHNLGYEMVEKPWFGIGSPADLKLQENMVVAPEWFINTPFGPMLFEENFLVTRDGLERLTDFPSKLQVVPD
ncbi:MAG: M24 family metallopeptidase, partial [Gammaproteobacteria bacterium]